MVVRLGINSFNLLSMFSLHLPSRRVIQRSIAIVAFQLLLLLPAWEDDAILKALLPTSNTPGRNDRTDHSHTHNTQTQRHLLFKGCEIAEDSVANRKGDRILRNGERIFFLFWRNLNLFFRAYTAPVRHTRTR